MDAPAGMSALQLHIARLEYKFRLRDSLLHGTFVILNCGAHYGGNNERCLLYLLILFVFLLLFFFVLVISSGILK